MWAHSFGRYAEINLQCEKISRIYIINPNFLDFIVSEI